MEQKECADCTVARRVERLPILSPILVRYEVLSRCSHRPMRRYRLEYCRNLRHDVLDDSVGRLKASRLYPFKTVIHRTHFRRYPDRTNTRNPITILNFFICLIYAD